MTAVLAAVGVATLVAGSIAMVTAGTAQADDKVPCGTPAQEAVYETIQHPAVPAVYETVVVEEAWTETIQHPAQYQTVTIPAVTKTVKRPGQRWAWNPQGPADESAQTPAWPVPEQGKWTENTSHYNGIDPLGVVFQEAEQGNGGNNASWFYWTFTTEEVVIEPERTETRLVKEAWTEKIDHPAVTEQRLVKDAVPAWTEQNLVTPAVPAGPPCEDDETPPPVKDVCTNINGVQAEVPDGYSLVDGVCEKDQVAPAETEKPKPTKPPKPAVVEPDEVAGTAEAVPTAVAAGLVVPTSTSTSPSSPLGQGLVGAGLVMLLLAGALQMGRTRGAHQA